MQTLLISSRVLGQLPARTMIYEKQKRLKKQKGHPQPSRLYIVILVYFPAHPSVHVCLSLPVILEPIGQTQTNLAGTQKSQTCGDATSFMAVGKRPKLVFPLRKVALKKDALPDCHLARQHTMLRTSCWDS